MKETDTFDDLDGLVIFDAIVSHGSLTAASAALHLPKATLSRRFAALEDGLGLQLMHRTTRSWALTDEGRELHGRIVPHLEALQQAAGRMRERIAGPMGLVRLSAPAGFGQADLVIALSEFLDRNPEVQVALTLQEQDGGTLGEAMDIVLMTGHIEDTNIATVQLRDKAYRLVASPAYLQAMGRPRRLADLADHEMVASSGDDEPLTRLLGDGVPRMRWRIAVASTAARHMAVRRGLGLAMLPAGLVADDVAMGRLVALELEDARPGTRAMTLLYPREGARSEAVRALGAFLVERFGG
ncbi:LysR family transcriptional regulator [Cereibacter sphaeroides]|nr:LysR family transcriptional regulator [Cereibacter sphaeroides]